MRHPRVVVTEWQTLRSGREETVVSLTQEIAWQMGRQDLTRMAVTNAVANAGKHLGHEYAFPDVETVEPADAD